MPLPDELERLSSVLLAIAASHDEEAITHGLSRAARELLGAHGSSFAIRDGDEVRHVGRRGVGWVEAGRRFAIDACLSGRALLEGEVAIVDVDEPSTVMAQSLRDARVRSAFLLPVRTERSAAAIGVYWAERRATTERDRALARKLAAAAAVALGHMDRARADASSGLQDRDASIAAAAHEVRNALNTVSLKLSMLRPSIREGGDRAEQGLARLDELLSGAIGQLDVNLGAARRRANGGDLRYEELDLVALVQAVMARFREDFEAVGSTALLHADVPVWGRWDRVRIETIVANLLSNAAKYGAGSPIDVEVAGEGPMARLEVVDHGRGIAKADQARVFQAFERTESASAQRGVGLGLWIVHRFVEAHAGMIRLESSEGQGARFIVLLPTDVVARAVTRAETK
jgi:signal transduction histidine kinase